MKAKGTAHLHTATATALGNSIQHEHSERCTGCRDEWTCALQDAALIICGSRVPFLYLMRYVYTAVLCAHRRGCRADLKQMHCQRHGEQAKQRRCNTSTLHQCCTNVAAPQWYSASTYGGPEPIGNVGKMNTVEECSMSVDD